MIPGLVERPRWPGRRWWAVVGLVFGLQLTIIFWLSESEPIRARRANPGPALKLTEREAAKLLELTGAAARDLGITKQVENEATRLLETDDPTLFALPHRQGFSGLAWLKAPRQEFQSFVWSEPPSWLPLPTEELGASFRQLMRTNEPDPLLVLSRPELGISLPEVSSANDFPQHSILRLTGELAHRHLLKRIELPSVAWPEILTNSRVQLVVGPDGRPFSPTLFYPGSGSPSADSNALWQATMARFEPLGNSDAPTTRLSGWTWGQMIFEWHTLPMPSTNAAR